MFDLFHLSSYARRSNSNTEHTGYPLELTTDVDSTGLPHSFDCICLGQEMDNVPDYQKAEFHRYMEDHQMKESLR